ncbi:MAG TPA: heavy-metal-associated domain-containing protein [Prolixibacteraceae bacterium]|nr:heavy-metal-associated domain-containing protein [Prolixibacteraceae bacterium]HPS13134.1 heavy-metal-associated domain-containing protein [Prolixibacteraceae bacterium]
MSTLKFKTNIHCGGCIAKVTPQLNQIEGIDRWDVDLTDPLKVLTVEADDIEPETIEDALKRVGYSATFMKD